LEETEFGKVGKGVVKWWVGGNAYSAENLWA